MIGVFFDEINEKVIRLMADEPLKRISKKPFIKLFEENDKIPEELYGTPIIVEILGYGNDGQNEGVVCRLQSTKPDVQKILNNEVGTFPVKIGRSTISWGQPSFSFP